VKSKSLVSAELPAFDVASPSAEEFVHEDVFVPQAQPEVRHHKQLPARINIMDQFLFNTIS
jgi:hypothetical protein